MSEDLKPYDEYLKTEVNWLSSIPRKWAVVRARHLLVEVNDRSISGNETPLSMSQRHGLIPSSQLKEHRLVSQSHIGAKRCQPGDIVLNRLKAHLGVLAMVLEPGLVSPDYTVVRMRRGDVLPRYVLAVLTSQACRSELFTRVRGVVEGFWRLYTADLYAISLPFSPPDEQAAIVRFLDYANRRLDRAIRAKRKLIALLNEQKQAIIHRAVTRGLDPNVPLKDSGVHWLGEIPGHWEVKKLRHLFRYAKGRRAAELTNEYIGQHGGSFPVYSGQTEADGIMGWIDWHEFEFMSPVVFVSTVGARAMSTKLVSGKFSLSQNCALIIPRHAGINCVYFENVFQRLFVFERASISLIMQPSLRFSDLNKFYVPHPPHDEQSMIGDKINQRTADIDSVRLRTEREIALIREYRTRLVADVVTGQLDVREAAAGLPDEETDEAELSDLQDEADLLELSDDTESFQGDD